MAIILMEIIIVEPVHLIFDGSNGYGVLTNNTGTGDYGNCNMTSWPMCNTISTAHAYGIGLRGEARCWNTSGGRLQTSDRYRVNTLFAMGGS